MFQAKSVKLLPQGHVARRFQEDVRMALPHCFLLADVGQGLSMESVLETGMDFMQMKTHSRFILFLHKNAYRKISLPKCLLHAINCAVFLYLSQ